MSSLEMAKQESFPQWTFSNGMSFFRHSFEWNEGKDKYVRLRTASFYCYFFYFIKGSTQKKPSKIIILYFIIREQSFGYDLRSTQTQWDNFN